MIGNLQQCTSFATHSYLTDLTQPSAYAFKLGLLSTSDSEMTCGPVLWHSNEQKCSCSKGRIPDFGAEAVGHIWQTAPNATIVGTWQLLGGGPPISQLALGQNADGRLELFGIDSDGTLFHIWQSTPDDSTSWGATWEPLGSGHEIKQIAVGQNADGHLEVFGVDPRGSALHLYWTPAGQWTNWEFLGSGHSASSLVVGQNHDGRLEVFDIDGSGIVFHFWQDPNAIGGWSNWVMLV